MCLSVCLSARLLPNASTNRDEIWYTCSYSIPYTFGPATPTFTPTFSKSINNECSLHKSLFLNGFSWNLMHSIAVLQGGSPYTFGPDTPTFTPTFLRNFHNECSLHKIYISLVSDHKFNFRWNLTFFASKFFLKWWQFYLSKHAG